MGNFSEIYTERQFDRSGFELNKEILEQEEATVRTKVTLACTECKQRNYNTMKNKKNTPDRIELMKYCKFCGKETLHKETK